MDRSTASGLAHHETDLMSLNEQIRQLSDRQAIADLITRLGQMLDEKRFDDAPTILADDVVVRTRGGSARGRAVVVQQARRKHRMRTQYMIANPLIELDGDRAEARVNVIVTFAPESDQPLSRFVNGDSEQPEPTRTVGERYRLDAVRGEAGWRLTSIVAVRLWSSEPPPRGARIARIDRGIRPVAA